MPRRPSYYLWSSCYCSESTGLGERTTSMRPSLMQRVKELVPPQPRPAHSAEMLPLTPDQVAARVRDALQASKLNPNQVTPLLPNPALKDCTTQAPVVTCAAIGGGNPQICFQSNVQVNAPTTRTIGLRGFGQLPVPVPVLSSVYIAEQPTDSAQSQRADHRRRLSAGT